MPGNHYIGWELLTTNDSPATDALSRELRASDESLALVTSEDLSLLYHRPESLIHLRDVVAASGFHPKIVVYFRAHAPYAESMYVERVKHDYVRPLGGYIDDVLRTGVYLPEGTLIRLEFDYPRLLAPFVAAFGRENIIIRPYRPSADPMHLFRDFLGIVAGEYPVLAQSNLQLTIPQARANQSLTFWELVRGAHAVCTPGRTPSIAEDLAAAMAPNDRSLYETKVMLLTRDEHLRIVERFAADTAAIEHDHGITLEGAHPEEIPPADDPRWTIAQQQRAIYDRLVDLWLTRKAAAPPPAE